MDPEQSFPAPPSIIPPTPEAPPPDGRVPQPVTAHHNPYEFITAPAPPKKVLLKGFGGSNFVYRLVFVVGGAVLLMIVLAVITNLVFSNRTNPAAMITLAQTQSEISRVATQGAQADDSLLRGAAVNTSLTMITQQRTLTAYLKKHGTGVDTKALALKKNLATDAQLKSAKATSTFDTVFTTMMVTDLTNYNISLKAAYQTATRPDQKQLLKDDYTQVQLLLSQWPAVAQTPATN